MTTVELVSNPEPNVSSYAWHVQGLSNLTRENKISSLPFWVPNNKTRRHQFRLVLLKGLVPAHNEAEDAYGLVLELVPPPTDAAGHEASASAYPGGCFVSVAVTNHERPTAGDVAASLTVLLDHPGQQASFPDLLPAASARSPSFLAGHPPTVSFVVTIRTGVNVLAQQITTSLTSLWSTLTSTVSRMADVTAKVYHEGRRELEDATPAAVPGSAQAARPPWDVTPPKWGSRAEQWRALVSETAVADDGVFLNGPDRGISDDERQLLLQSGLNYRQLLDLYTGFDFDRDVHEGLLGSSAIRQQRYHLVPAKINEGLFWANYFWKVACLAACDSDAQARIVLSILNAPPPGVAAPPPNAALPASSEEVASAVADAQEAADLLLECLSADGGDGDPLLVQAAAHTCEDHVKRMDALFCRTDLPESTLVAVGSTLRCLRERIANYKQMEAGHSAPPPPPPPPATPADATPLKESIAPVHETGPAADAPPPEPTIPPAPPASPPTPPPPAATAVASEHAAAPSAPRGTSTSVPRVDFPKMPWEEEGEEDAI